MNREGHESARFFVGNEVEHTPAYGLKTLFVVGLQPVDEIRHWYAYHSCRHIYFGANQSFPNLEIYDGDGWRPWERMIQDCLDTRILCTLDLDVGCAEGLLESTLVDYNNFIPMLSVKLPYIRQLGYNATLKIDDKDFEQSNPGVWCHSLYALQKREVFTPWSKYTQDEVIK